MAFISLNNARTLLISASMADVSSPRRILSLRIDCSSRYFENHDTSLALALSYSRLSCLNVLFASSAWLTSLAYSETRRFILLMSVFSPLPSLLIKDCILPTTPLRPLRAEVSKRPGTLLPLIKACISRIFLFAAAIFDVSISAELAKTERGLSFLRLRI